MRSCPPPDDQVEAPADLQQAFLSLASYLLAPGLGHLQRIRLMWGTTTPGRTRPSRATTADFSRSVTELYAAERAVFSHLADVAVAASHPGAYACGRPAWSRWLRAGFRKRASNQSSAKTLAEFRANSFDACCLFFGQVQATRQPAGAHPADRLHGHPPHRGPYPARLDAEEPGRQGASRSPSFTACASFSPRPAGQTRSPLIELRANRHHQYRRDQVFPPDGPDASADALGSRSPPAWCQVATGPPQATGPNH